MNRAMFSSKHRALMVTGQEFTGAMRILLLSLWKVTITEPLLS